MSTNQGPRPLWSVVLKHLVGIRKCETRKCGCPTLLWETWEGGKVVTQISSALYASLSCHPFVAVRLSQNLVFFCLSQTHREVTFTHWSGASLLQVHPLTGRVKYGLPFFSSSFWHWYNLQNQYTGEKCLIINTKLIDGTFSVIHQSAP